VLIHSYFFPGDKSRKDHKNLKNRKADGMFNVQRIKVNGLYRGFEERTTPSAEAAATPPFPRRGALRVQCSTKKSKRFEFRKL